MVTVYRQAFSELKMPIFRGFSLTTEVKTSINNEVGITVYGYPSGIGASENRKIKFTVKIQRRNFEHEQSRISCSNG